MRVTFVLPGFVGKPTGGARVVYEYAGRLAARGHAVTVVHGAVLEPWQYARPLLWRRALRHTARGLLDLLGRRPSWPSWHEGHPGVSYRYRPTLAARSVPDADVVVATAWDTAESVLRYPPGKGAKCYLVQHYETWSGPKARVDATWRAPLRKVVIARWLADVAADLGAGEVVRVPNAIDHDVFRVVTPVEGRRPRVAMLYHPSPQKGGAVGLRALSLAKQAFPALEAVLFGVRPRPRDLPAWVEYVENPSPDRLVRDVYNASALYLCPSPGEGWHLPPAEAMACGCAVVSTAIGGVGDYAVDGETAVLAPVGDAAALAEGLVALCRDEARREALAHAGGALVRTFTWERSTDLLEGHLAALVGGDRR